MIFYKKMYNKDMNTNNFIDFNVEPNHIIQWIEESEIARRTYQCELFRVALAMRGLPSRDLYQEEMEGIIKGVKDPEKQRRLRDKCTNLPKGKSFAIKKAVDNIAAQMSGGVDSYEYTINDPYMIIDADTEDLLSAKCKQDYINSHLGEMAPVISNDLKTAGLTAWYVKYDVEKDLNIVFRINPKNTWWDTKYSATGIERFRGYSTMISYAKLKKMIEDDGDEVNLNIEAPNYSLYDEKGEFKNMDKRAKYSNRKIRTLNGLDIYVQNLNKLAASPDLPSGLRDYAEYDHDLRRCYNLNWYRSLATDPKQRTNNGYNGDDVELTVIYDLSRKIEYKIINRRFVIAANAKKFCRKIAFPLVDPTVPDEEKPLRPHIEDFHLDCPLKMKWSLPTNRDIQPYPHSELFDLLDMHDELCAWYAKRAHVSKILATLRLVTNGADAAALEDVFNIMGIVIPNLQGDIESLNFQYSYDPIDSEIARLEGIIQQTLHAYDQFDALQAMGDRASAAESGMALGAVAQGLAVHQNTIMSLYAEIARQCIANRVAYSPLQEFPVSAGGTYSSVTLVQMALEATIDVKPVLAKKVQEKMLSTTALSLIGAVGQEMNNRGLSYLVEMALMGTAPRGMIEGFLLEPQASPQEIALAQQEAQNMAAQLQQNQQAYQLSPIPYEVDNVMQNSTPEEIDEVIEGVSTPAGTEEMAQTELLEMPQQDAAFATDLAISSPEMGSQMANSNTLVG